MARSARNNSQTPGAHQQLEPPDTERDLVKHANTERLDGGEYEPAAKHRRGLSAASQEPVLRQARVQEEASFGQEQNAAQRNNRYSPEAS